MSKVEYPGEQVDVTWDGRLCIHVGECGRAEGALFEAGRKPWCQPDVSQADDVVDVCARCPTGALTWARKDGGATEVADARNTVVVANHGPLYVRGELAIDGAADDMPGTAFRAALCRCGQSKRKPFCDNSHEAAGFQDRGAVGQRGPGLESTGGTLAVKRIPNGPLIVDGAHEIVASSGQVRWRGTRSALCRCGASANKPFCDGSHRKIGFKAE
jgi:CDGSH-type Zn-finger protein/uncharacterized Fe-S cluster protein YjdI